MSRASCVQPRTTASQSAVASRDAGRQVRGGWLAGCSQQQGAGSFSTRTPPRGPQNQKLGPMCPGRIPSPACTSLFLAASSTKPRRRVEGWLGLGPLLHIKTFGNPARGMKREDARCKRLQVGEGQNLRGNSRHFQVLPSLEGADRGDRAMRSRRWKEGWRSPPSLLYAVQLHAPRHATTVRGPALHQPTLSARNPHPTPLPNPSTRVCTHRVEFFKGQCT